MVRGKKGSGLWIEETYVKEGNMLNRLLEYQKESQEKLDSLKITWRERKDHSLRL